MSGQGAQQGFSSTGTGQQQSGGASSNLPEDVAARSFLSVDLAAVRANYRNLAELYAPGTCAAVVKADAYGLGLAPVADALWHEGCRTFFVATLDEGKQLRARLDRSDVVIYVLDGLLPGCAAALCEAELRPVLGSLAEIEDWAGYCAHTDVKHPCAIHIDTGMNRLGLSPDEVPALAARQELFDKFDLALVMTHLVSGELRGDPLTKSQAALFDDLRDLLPAAPASFANSAGTLLVGDKDGQGLRYDLARPGVALYGAHVFVDRPNPMQPVITLHARVLKVRTIEGGDTIGYNATWRAEHPMRVATLAYGYADGLLRSLSATNEQPGLPVYFGDQPAPLLGRISMDYIGVDVSALAEGQPVRGDWAELIGPHVTIDDMAIRAGTNAYEILTSLGARSRRRYLSGRDDSRSPRPG